MKSIHATNARTGKPTTISLHRNKDEVELIIGAVESFTMTTAQLLELLGGNVTPPELSTQYGTPIRRGADRSYLRH